MPEDVDALIAEYQDAVLYAEERREHLIAVVEAAGTAPANATVSKRLSGLAKSVLVTWGMSTSVDEVGIAALKAYLERQQLPELFDRLFALQEPKVYVPPAPSHRRVGDAATVLLQMPKRLKRAVEDKIVVLCAGALTLRVNAPAVKITEVLS